MRTDYAAIGRLLGHPTRSDMLNALMDGRALTAGELARAAAVPASSASEHLAVLTEGGLVQVRASGRHRYYTLAGPEVASALEGLDPICLQQPTAPTLRRSLEAERLRHARTCYDHLAGEVGVLLLDRLLARSWLAPVPGGFAATDAGAAGLRELGIDVGELSRRRRAFALACLDWTERRYHLGGALGAAIATLSLDRGWVQRPAQDRGLLITAQGRTASLWSPGPP